jgi:hypothetical protein
MSETTIPAKCLKLIQQYERHPNSVSAHDALKRYLDSDQLTLIERVLVSRRIRGGAHNG